ncbi:hypothetical protein [Pelagibacterium sp. H642]|uniref:hypothetical protein n=1 Tax=Pelagibacterium sp. H642 TaxID=1881069 RepID=UPI002814BDD0|nr:hypothetical protein [Pelagibacterium sp. H642]WMT91288.1 hypothetical protein NO934_03230 [Pelagibacterium sp. H642]
MAKIFNDAVFEEWQELVQSWERTERQLAELKAAPDQSQTQEREAKLHDELARLKSEIDGLVQRMSNGRDRSGEEMLVVLVDTKPERTSFASMVRERLARLPGRR